MLSAGNEVITPLSLDTNGNLSKTTYTVPTPQPPGGEAEDAHSLTSTWKIKPNK